KMVVDPVNRGQLSPCSPSEKSLAQRDRNCRNPRVPGWSEEASDMALAPAS
ncbi:hypothetical protein A2U01_0063431, partial [Trifolium medium]|nr:hypothetical protein [Trifolium medium]